MDLPTLSTIYKSQARPPALFLPLNNVSYIPKEIPRASIIELDWWEGREVDVADVGKIRITCSASEAQSSSQTKLTSLVSSFPTWLGSRGI